MNEKVEHLILEHLRAVRADISSMKEEMAGMRGEMFAMRQHMGGLMSAQLVQDTEIAGLKVRIERMEKRLELSE
ncbi:MULTISPECIES: hypothetical protein [unclassified Rhizobium]|jgi:hypothetical protein|uniref:hypothetical protein n=1 Tax=unclassified Rhizobium TaxID=2613769 RepID=UPI000365EAD3|nr:MULTISPECIES: hypothetical protein [unclassified Rhizobium]